MLTKHQRQLINRAAGFSGSFMPESRAISIAKEKGIPVTAKSIEVIQLDDRAMRCNKL